MALPCFPGELGPCDVLSALPKTAKERREGEKGSGTEGKHICLAILCGYHLNIVTGSIILILILVQSQEISLWHVRLVSLEIWFIRRQISRRRFLMQGRFNL
jgi:hypothetical protein